MSETSETKSLCDLCGTKLSPPVSDFYCHGCEAYICEQHPGMPWGNHDPLEHDKGPFDEDKEPFDE